MSNNLSNLETHLAAAVEIGDQAEREAYLRRACQGDSRRLEELQGMVHDYFAAGSLFDRPAVLAPTLDVDAQPEVGTCVGPYKLRKLLGEGGMGSVYVAEQEKPVRRKVALKVIKPGMDSRQVIARFEAERQALALMEHTNIARVLDAGTTDGGRPYFVMELVKGLPITEHCDSTEFTTRQRLELFLQVCRAVQHAHQKGVIHRDLKPSNVLVTMHDTVPMVKVIDFGVAKAIGQQLRDGTLYTGFSQLVGTPLYMSPEQAGQSGLDIDTRSDIYSLGVLLYELLTGTTPFDGETLRQAGIDEVRRIVREEDPPSPSTRVSTLEAAALSTIAERRHVQPQQLSRQLRGELDWIVMKALEKDRARRYETVNGFGEDICRYLADEPVVACPPSRSYRFFKFARRNKVGLAFAAVLLISVPIVLVAVTLATIAQQRAISSERELEQRRLAVQRGISDTLAEVARVKGATEPAAEDGDARLYRARELLQRALGLADSGPVTPDQLASLRELAVDLDNEHNHRQLLAALDLAWKAQMTTDPTRSSFRRTACIPMLQQALESFGIEVGSLSPKEAATAIRARPVVVRDLLLAALEEWHALAPPAIGMNWGATPSGAVLVMGIFPDSPAARDGRLKVGDRLVGVGQGSDGPLVDTRQMTTSDFAGVMSNQKQPNLQLQVIPQGESEPRTYVIQQDTTRSWLAATIESIDDDPWRARLRQALNTPLRSQRDPLLQELAEELDVERQPVRILTRFAVKLPVAEDASNLLREIWRLHPTDLVCILELGDSYLWKMNPPKFEEAIRYYTAAVVLDPNNAGAHFNLAFAFNSLDQTDDAIRRYREAHRLEPDWPAPLINLSEIFSRQGNVEESISMYRKTVESRPDNAALRTNYGVELGNLGRTEEAIAEHREAIRLDPGFAMAHVNLGCALSDQEKLDEAIAEHREAVRLEPNYALAHYNLGYVLSKQEKWDEAAAEYREAVNIEPSPYFKQKLEFFLTNSSWELANAREPAKRDPVKAIEWAQEATVMKPKNANHRNNLGVAFYRAGQWQSAIDNLEEADQMISGGDRLHRMFLAMAYLQLGNLTQAREVYAQGLNVFEPDSEQTRFRSEAEQLMGLTAADRLGILQDYLSQAAQREPENATVLATLARFYARQADWTEASKHLAEAIRLNPDDNGMWYQQGWLLLKTGDPAAYRAFCIEALARHADDSQVVPYSQAIELALQRPDSEMDWDDIAKKQRQLVQTQAKPLTSLGLAEYRAGQFAAALSCVESAMTAPQPEPKVPRPERIRSLFVLSMVYGRLKRPDEAQAAFELAQDLWSRYDQHHRKQYELLPANGWINWIQIPDLRDQAAAALQELGQL